MSFAASHEARRADAGLTLVETLAAMALVLVVAAVFTMTYRTAVQVLRRETAAPLPGAADAAEFMRSDLTRVAGFPTGDDPVFSLDTPENPGIRFIALALRGNESDPSWSHALRVEYRYRPDESALLRVTEPYAGPGDTITNRLASDCRVFSAACFDGLQWQDTWDSSEHGPPRAVRLTWVTESGPHPLTNELMVPVPAAFAATSSILRSQMPAQPAGLE